MLKIRPEQMTAFTQVIRDQANHRLAAYARQRFPRRFRDTAEAELVDLAEAVREAANGYGVQKEDDVGTFLDLTVMYGDAFHQASWAAGVLGNKALHGPDKMNLLRHQVRLTDVRI